MEKDAFYWKGQIEKYKADNKNFFDTARKCEDAYCSGKSYNIFYSNVQLLKAYLLTNNPKPEVERRFLKKLASDKLQYNTYLEIANILEGVLSYYTEEQDFIVKLKAAIENQVKVGRGVLWVDYEPIIEKVVNPETLAEEEFIADRKITISSLGYEDYACSSSINKQQIWWKARRHLLSKEELLRQFNYEADDNELNFSCGKDTDRKLAEVWEIWDKSEKKRIYILAAAVKNQVLKESKDPYGISSFFPCEDLTLLTNGKNIIPIPEYELYRKKAVLLDKLSERADLLEGKINYVITTDKSNQDNVAEMQNAGEGDIITLATVNPLASGNVGNSLGYLPIEQALKLAEHREIKKAQLKQDIYDITGIADIMRGQTDANETATAQKIKGVFGSLRFQDRQKQVQDFVVSIFEILAEIICENWDKKTLQEITSTYLPSEEEKAQIQANIAQLQVIQSNPEYQQGIASGILPPPPQVSKEDLKKLEQPSWAQIVGIMRDNKLRNYTIEVQSSATIFDDAAEQAGAITALSNSFKEIVATAVQLQSPAILRAYIPIAKMQLTSIKIGRAIGKQLIENLEQGAEELEKSLMQPKQDPALELAKQDLAIKQADIARKASYDKAQELYKAKELMLEEGKLKEQALTNEEKAVLKRREEERKQAELQAEYALKKAALAIKGNVSDTNIAIR